MGSSKAEEIRQEIIEEEEEEGGKEHFHVLAVDDSLIERKMLEKLLTISSYQVTCVESGDKALEYLGLVDHHSLPPPDDQHGHGMRVNLIMTDYSMPGISGYDLLKRVKGSSWKDVPVVVMSSENVPSRIDMCLEGGAEDFLLKPVRLSDLKKLQPHILKTTSTSQYCYEKNSTNGSKDLPEEGNSCNLVANDNKNISNNDNYDYKQGILIDDHYPNNFDFDKGKTRVDDDHFDIDRGPKAAEINYSVNVFS